MGSIRAQMIEINIIVALLQDVSNVHGLVFNTRACRLTCNKLVSRATQEGLGFLTKTLPRLGKTFDKALLGTTLLNSTAHGFDTMDGSELPRFLGEFFSRVFQPNGALLPVPCTNSIKVLRQIFGLFYKYELPYTDEQEQAVVDSFKKAENDIETHASVIKTIDSRIVDSYSDLRRGLSTAKETKVARDARKLLAKLFSRFDPTDIRPRHGPGAVATRQRLWDKYLWTNVSAKITELYPLDEYFYASLGHVCDSWERFQTISDKDLPARVILVPKDSRGPRLISCEPVDYQWVQQGLGRAIVSHVERHYLTRENVRFTDQSPNRFGALLGSLTGGYATLDLKEASDRVSVDLVHLLFPEKVYTYLMACRSSSTVLPNGEELKLRKFAPMGSCLCFPIMALTIWAILTAGAPDTDTQQSVYVYGDDVIVPTAYAGDAIELLESFGLKINRDKSCTSGLFRESCGMDAYSGVDVTPVRIRTVWSSTPCPNAYSSWIAYANSFWERKYYKTYWLIVGELLHVYGAIPDKSMGLPCPSLYAVPNDGRPKRRRYNKNLQRFEYFVTDIKSPSITKDLDGWSMLLRYFAETGASLEEDPDGYKPPTPLEEPSVFSVSSYTSRKTSMLVRRWR